MKNTSNEKFEKFLALLGNVDICTEMHSIRVGIYTDIFLGYLFFNETKNPEIRALTQDDVVEIIYAAYLHDIGKAIVPLNITRKNGRLTDLEFKAMKQHPENCEIFFERPEEENIRNIIRHHHERFDGRGYPDGVFGKNIPIGSRIISILDSFDAMTAERPYNVGHTRELEDACDEIMKNAGGQFDKKLVESFCKMCYSDYGKNLLNINNRPELIETFMAKHSTWFSFDENTKSENKRMVYGRFSNRKCE